MYTQAILITMDQMNEYSWNIDLRAWAHHTELDACVLRKLF